MIISIKGIDFDVEYTYHGGCRQTDVDPGEEPYIRLMALRSSRLLRLSGSNA